MSRNKAGHRRGGKGGSHKLTLIVGSESEQAFWCYRCSYPLLTRREQCPRCAAGDSWKVVVA